MASTSRIERKGSFMEEFAKLFKFKRKRNSVKQRNSEFNFERSVDSVKRSQDCNMQEAVNDNNDRINGKKLGQENQQVHKENANLNGKEDNRHLITLDKKKSGSDRYLAAKTAFLQEVNTQNLSSKAQDEDKLSKDNNRYSKKEELAECSKQKQVLNINKKFVSREIKAQLEDSSDDSDFSADSMEDSIEESSEDENENLLECERGNITWKDQYFTKGKYISYFFLEMERQCYNPSDVYNMIHYNDFNDSNKPDKEGERITLESLTHGCQLHPRHKLMHRTSADNLVTTSPPNSIKHSSPESVKSAPGQIKPRSTSQDAISPKKDIRNMAGVAGASMDSLAKNTLIAARVFNLIPAQKARERNYLHGRCAATSLLGPAELEKVLPNRELKIFIGTWNMNGQTPPKELNDFMLPSHVESVPDMLAIGTQESCSERFEWEVALQETLGPTHVLLSSTGLGTLHLALFVRRDLIWYCSITEEDSFSTRTGSAFRTKGAVALGLILFGTSFLFVTAHLTAHQDKVKERVSDIKRIVRNLDLPKELPIKHKSKDVTQNFDCVFWCGDLNFRLAQPREEVIQWVTGTSFPQQSPVNLHKDQLKITLSEDAILRGFEEAPITFPPTYKYDPGTQNFDSSSKQRTPSYTDRILFKSKNHSKGYIRRLSHESTSSQRDGVIECLVYDSVPSICTSDHKPVWGVFKTTIRPGVDTIPLSAGVFNHEVYAEGIKRRVAAMDEYRETAKVCSMQ